MERKINQYHLFAVLLFALGLLSNVAPQNKYLTHFKLLQAFFIS
jgi:hypothetical protein